MPFDIDAARKDGASDSQIAEYLSSEQDFDLSSALSDGASYDQILPYLLEQDKPDTSFLGGVADAAIRPVKGAANTFLTAGRGVVEDVDALTNLVGADDLISNDNAATRWINDAQDNVGDWGDSAYDGHLSQFLEGMGSMGAFAASAVLTRGRSAGAFAKAGGFKKLFSGAGFREAGKAALKEYKGALPFAGFTGAGEAADMVRQARMQGVDVSEGQEDAAAAFGSLIGFSELLPVERFLRGVNASQVGRGFTYDILQKAKRALINGGAEGVQEVTASLMQDATAKGIYNPEQKIGESAWSEFVVGGEVGAATDLLFQAFSGRRRKVLTKQALQEEEERRGREKVRLDELAKKFPDMPRAEIAGLLPYIGDAEIDLNDPQAKIDGLIQGMETELGDNFPVHTTFGVQKEGDKFVVANKGGFQYGPQFATEAEATTFRNGLQDHSVGKGIEQDADMAMAQSASDYTPSQQFSIREFARKLFHPKENTFLAAHVNSAAGTTIESDFEHEQMTAQQAKDAGVSVKDMTAAQRINLKRLKKGLPETHRFTLQEARSELGDKYGLLSDYQFTGIGANEQFQAKKVNGKFTVSSKIGGKRKGAFKSGLVIDSRRATPTEEAEGITGRVEFKGLREAQNYAKYLNEQAGRIISRADIQGDKPITIAMIEDLMADKGIDGGIDSKGMQSVTNAITGQKKKTKVSDLSQADLANLYYKLRSLPNMAEGNTVNMPVFGLRPYTGSQYNKAKQALIQRSTAPNLELGQQVIPTQEEIGGDLSKTAYEQLVRDLKQDTEVQARVAEFQNQRQANNEASAEAALVRDKEQKRIEKAARKVFSKWGLKRAGLTFVERLRQARRGATGEVELGAEDPSKADSYGAYSKPMNELFVAVDAIRQNPRYIEAKQESAEAAEAVLEELVIETLGHETLHAMRQADLFTQNEWEMLKKTAFTKINPESGMNYVETAVAMYPEITNPETLFEEAIAEMVRHGLTNPAVKKNLSQKQKSLFKRIMEYMKGIFNMQDAIGYYNFDQIINAIETGQIAQRPDAIRSLKETERGGGSEATVSRGSSDDDTVEQRARVKSGNRTGKYVGAPEGIDTPQKLGGILNKMTRMAREGEFGRFWYERSGRQILDAVNGNKSEADKIIQAIAITSPNTPVEGNFQYALQAYTQWKAGQPIMTGMFPKAMVKKIEDVFAGKNWEGRKTNNFYNNLMSAIDPSKVQGATIDIWMMRAFGFWQKSPTDAMYTFAENEVQAIADKLGWKTYQVQAAIWVTMKSRMQNKEVKKKTERISEKNGWITYRKNKDGKNERVILNEEKHAKNWLKQAAQHKPDEADRERAKFDYQDALNASLAQVSWETIPGRTTGHMQEAHSAPQEVLIDYHTEMSKAFLSPNGNDLLAEYFGIPSPLDFEAPGFFEGRVSPSTQTRLVAPRQYKGKAFGEIEGAAEDLIEAYAIARGILLKQDAMGWHRPFFSDAIAKKNYNGADVDMGRPLTAREASDMAAIMEKLSGHGEYSPIGTPNGFRLIKWGYLSESNQRFQKMVDTALQGVTGIDNITSVGLKWFASKDGYLTNNWQENKDGQGYYQVGRLAQRPDLQRRVQSIVQHIKPRVRAVEQEFSDKYGWTESDTLEQRPARPTESAVRPSGRSAEGGITLSQERVDGASTFAGVHFGQNDVDTLSGERYGTGIRGAEAKRLSDPATDPRIKRRVYFYIPDSTGAYPHKEEGLGPHKYQQTFDNILNADSEEAYPVEDAAKNIKSDAWPNRSNDFESAVINAGYDGYAVPDMKMMVILNHDVPVSPADDTLEQRPLNPNGEPIAPRTPIREEAGVEIGGYLKSWWDRNFRAKGNLDDAAFAAYIVADSRKGAENLHAEHLMRDFKKAVKDHYNKDYTELGDSQKAALNDYLAGEGNDIPASLQTQIAPMRDYLDRLSSQMISEGVVRGDVIETILENEGHYLNRSYQVFDDDKWLEKVKGTPIWTNAHRYLTEVSQETGYIGKAPITDDAAQNAILVDGLMHNILIEGKAADNIAGIFANRRLGQQDVSMLVRRKQIAEPIRELLGEYKDPVVNFTKTATKLQYAIANHVMLKTMLQDGVGSYMSLYPTEQHPYKMSQFDSLFENENEHVYASMETAKAFAEALEQKVFNDVYRHFLMLNGAVKYGKTVLSVTTMARNVLSAFMFSMANGHVMTPQFFSEFANSFGTLRGELKGREGQREYYLNLKRLGVTLDNPFPSEMIGAVNDAMTANATLGKGKQGVKKFFGFFTKMYQYGDDLWKVVGYESEKAALERSGMSTERNIDVGGHMFSEVEVESARRIRDTYPTYSLIGKQIKRLRRFPLMGTFVSFPAEIVRTSVNIARTLKQDMDAGRSELVARRVAGMSVAAGWAAVLTAITKAWMGFDDEDDETIRKLSAPWMRNSNLAYAGYDKDGMPEFFDLSYLDPYNYLKRPINAMLMGGDWKENVFGLKAGGGLRDVLDPFLGPDIAAQALFEVAANKRMDGAPVYNDVGTAAEISGEIANHIRKAIQPGTAMNIERMLKATANETSRGGTKYTMENEMYALVGFRRTTLNPMQSGRYKAYDMREDKAKAARLLSYPLGGQNAVSDEEIGDAFESMMRGRQKAYTDMAESVDLLRKVGLSPVEIRKVLNSSGLSKKDVAYMIRGEIPRWRPSPQFLKAARDSAVYTSAQSRRADLKLAFRHRQRLVSKLARDYYR